MATALALQCGLWVKLASGVEEWRGRLGKKKDV